MKKIIIVDNRPPVVMPDLSPFPFVIYKEQFPDIKSQNPLDIATVCIHASNRTEVNWASDHKITPRFLFSGEISEPGHVRGIYNIPRALFYRHIVRFLEIYKTQQRVEHSVFFSRTQAEMTSAAKSDSEQLGFMQFAKNGAVDRPGFIELQSTADGAIDFVRTLMQLSTISGPLVFLIEETYLNRQDGIKLAYRIRTSAFLGEFCRWPIRIKLVSKPHEIARFDPRLAHLIFSDGIELVEQGECSPTAPTPITPISFAQYVDFLSLMNLPLPQHKTNHDLSNQWAALRLHQGYLSISGSTSAKFLSSPEATRLLASEYYGLMLSRAAVSTVAHNGTENTSLFGNFISAFQQWKSFLSNFASAPRKVLLLDDDACLGWEHAVKSLFSEFPSITVVSYPSDTSFSLDESKTLINTTAWDLILCDIRLMLDDRATGTNSDQQKAGHLSGIKIIEYSKSNHPNVPVIAFTASEKHWTYRHALNVGADAWWTKENPQLGFDDNESKSNIVVLLQSIEEVVKHKQKNKRLWELRQFIVKSLDDSDYLKKFLPLGTSRPELKDIIASIAARLTTAYGYLDYKPNKFYKSTFFHYPLNLAFLNIWSCSNDILRLYYYEDLTKGDYLWLCPTGSGYAWETYAKARSKLYFEAKFQQMMESNYLARKIISRDSLTGMQHAKSAPFSWITGKGLSLDYVVMLIRNCAAQPTAKASLELDFQNCRTGIRNRLNIEHGDYQTSVHAAESDITKMLSVLETLLWH